MFEEGQPRLAQQPGMIGGGLVQRVERDDGRCVERMHGLHEAGGVARDAGAMAAERITLVVVAHQQDRRRIQAGENRGEIFVSAVFAPMREIAGDDDEGDIGMIAVDPVDGCSQPLSGIEAVDLAAARDKVGIGEDDELHRTMVSRSHAL